MTGGEDAYGEKVDRIRVQGSKLLKGGPKTRSAGPRHPSALPVSLGRLTPLCSRCEGPKKFRHGESNPGHLRDREIY